MSISHNLGTRVWTGRETPQHDRDFKPPQPRAGAAEAAGPATKQPGWVKPAEFDPEKVMASGRQIKTDLDKYWNRKYKREFLGIPHPEPVDGLTIRLRKGYLASYGHGTTHKITACAKVDNIDGKFHVVPYFKKTSWGNIFTFPYGGEEIDPGNAHIEITLNHQNYMKSMVKITSKGKTLHEFPLEGSTDNVKDTVSKILRTSANNTYKYTTRMKRYDHVTRPDDVFPWGARRSKVESQGENWE